MSVVDRVDRDERGRPSRRSGPGAGPRASVGWRPSTWVIRIAGAPISPPSSSAAITPGTGTSVATSRRRTAASRPAVYRASVDLPAGPQPALEDKASGRAVRPDQVDAVDRGGDAALQPPGACDAPARTRGALDPGAGSGIDGRVPGGSCHPAILTGAEQRVRSSTHATGRTAMDWTLEVVIVPVSDIDRSIAFYRDRVGFDLDHDTQQRADARRAADAARLGLLDRVRRPAVAERDGAGLAQGAAARAWPTPPRRGPSSSAAASTAASSWCSRPTTAARSSGSADPDGNTLGRAAAQGARREAADPARTPGPLRREPGGLSSCRRSVTVASRAALYRLRTTGAGTTDRAPNKGHRS